ncbi:MAG TPA: CGNR zinc finger domain-containing protein [Amycolatopsis sp.]|nr:CGNR zinc finger domain-containing protein [Amycolatopsis sp.]
MPDRSADETLVVDFLNTVDVENGTDVLADRFAWRRWGVDRGLEAGALDTARAARDALRHAVGDPDAQRSDLLVPARIELAAHGPRLVAPDAVGAVLAAAVRLTVLGDWERLKICPADDCRWAFCDHSRNRSRTWCSMRVCGNREKARAWRERTGR